MSERPAYIEVIEGNRKITTFKIGDPEEQQIIEQIHIKGLKICLDCNKSFKPNSNNQDYCTNCRKIKWNKYMKERMSEDRLMMKLASFSNAQIEIFNELTNKQQFIEDVPINNDKYCIICKSNINLIEHHIRYTPIEKVILCRKCHVFLHNNILKRRKCRPEKF